MKDYAPHEGIIKATFGLIGLGRKLTHDQKLSFARSLEWILKNVPENGTEKEKEVLAWAYLIRGKIYAGHIPEVCED